MGPEIIALIAGLLALIPVILNALNNRKANRNDIGKVESAELRDGMDAVDAATRVQPPKQQG
jgi:hypothetical protein